ncbi:MAG: hypothetical protein M3P08_06650 [Thermoproteota archaeon]|nr:hypothetical protein [Thermoproteota archaeon]
MTDTIFVTNKRVIIRNATMLGVREKIFLIKLHRYDLEKEYSLQQQSLEPTKRPQKIKLGRL